MPFLALLTVCAVVATAQSRISNAAIETRQVTRPLEREMEALAARGRDLWIGYRVPTLPTSRQFCGGSRVLLEPSTEIILMARLESGLLRRLRTFTPECDIDAGGQPVAWLEPVTADASAAWLAGLARSTETRDEWERRVASPALQALALHPGQAAVAALIALARSDVRSSLRRRALVSLGERAGQEASAALGKAIQDDPETEVKKQAVIALSRLPKDEGVPLLIEIARTHKNPEVRRQAMLLLGRSADARAVSFFEQILMEKK